MPPVNKIKLPTLSQVFEKKDLSTAVKTAFPNVRKKVKGERIEQELPEAVVKDDDFDDILKSLVNKGKDDHKSLNFFYGGLDTKFKDKVLEFNLVSDNEAFIDFLLSNSAERIMKQNRLKIHIETGNIWYDGFDTGESIFTFLKMQQNDDMIFIENHFLYNDSYKNYFGNYINNIDGEINSKLDFFTNRNARYLLYRFIDLLTNVGIDLVRVRHSQKV